jgi:DMSO/TMAO reductase YedYZ molybdopterin-dependent catalytic subunit
MMKKFVVAFLILLIIAPATILLVDEIRLGRILERQREYGFTEIREYEGKKLSSIRDFRENSINGPQKVDIDAYRLTIAGLVGSPKNFTYNEVLGKHEHHNKVLTLDCVEGWSVTLLWEGVLVRDLLQETSPLPTAKVVIFHAVDGYTTSLPLEYVLDKEVMLTYKMNDVTLPPERGFPFQLAAEGKWGYKWIKWVAKIELSDDVKYRGFWESRGYSNDGDLDRPFLGA